MTDTGIQRIYKHESTQYTTVPNWVVRDPDYSPNAFRLLAYLLSHADGYELTYGQIERQTTLGRYAINQAAKFLIEQGWLEWRQEKGADGRWLAKQWIIKDPRQTAPVWNDSTTESFRSGTINGHKEEQVLEKNTDKETHLAREDFDKFWEAYPRKLDKSKAERAFRAALKRASFDEILFGVIAYRDDAKRDPDYTKYPATWLNSDSWQNATAQPDNEAAQRAARRRDRELEQSAAVLAEIKEREKLSAPPPQCDHGMNLALCRKCSKND